MKKVIIIITGLIVLILLIVFINRSIEKNESSEYVLQQSSENQTLIPEKSDEVNSKDIRETVKAERETETETDFSLSAEDTEKTGAIDNEESNPGSIGMKKNKEDGKTESTVEKEGMSVMEAEEEALFGGSQDYSSTGKSGSSYSANTSRSNPGKSAGGAAEQGNVTEKETSSDNNPEEETPPVIVTPPEGDEGEGDIGDTPDENPFEIARSNENLTYEYFLNQMTAEEKMILYEAAPSPQEYLNWVAEMRNAYNTERDKHITNAEEGIKF